MKNFLLFLIFFCGLLNISYAQSLTMKYPKVGIRAPIPVEFQDGSGINGSWIGLYRASEPDGNYITYKYINELKNGALVFDGLINTGIYNFRLYEDGGYKKIATSNSFLVVQGMIIDTSFGINGKFTWDASLEFGNSLANGAKAVKLTKDGKLLIAGAVKTGKLSINGVETIDFTVVKLNKDGFTDPLFGANGKVRITPKSSYFQIYPTAVKAIALQEDGKIIIGGDLIVSFPDNSIGYLIVLIRLLDNGTIDENFGDKGVVVHHFTYDGELNSNVSDDLRCIELSSDQKILVGGGSIINAPFAPGRPFIGRFLQNGMPDASFGTVGIITPLDSTNWRAYVECIIPPIKGGDGTFNAIATARAQFGANHQLLYKFNTQGTFNLNFGNGKPVVERRPGIHNETFSKQIINMPDGDILMYGGSDIYAQWLIKRSATTGAGIPGFGNQGLVFCDPAELEVPAGMFIDKDKISFAYTGNGRQLSMSRYDLNGNFDVVFGNPYFEFLDQSGLFIEYNAMDVIKQDNNRYVMVGAARFYNPPHYETFAYAFKDNPAVFTLVNEADKDSKNVLLQNYPNPFNNQCTIPFNLENPSDVSIELFNLQGLKLLTVFDGKLSEGYHEVKLDNLLLNDKITQGVYIYSLRIRNNSGTERISKTLVVR